MILLIGISNILVIYFGGMQYINGEIENIGLLKENQLSDFLGGAKALLFPIRWEEPFGLVMIEAMACGTPVIAFKKGSVSEVVKHNKTGFVVKDDKEMIAAINDVHNGKHYIAKDIAQQLALSVLPGETNPIDNLSRREIQVLMMISQGSRTQEISNILNLSPKTISTYRKRLYEKLEVNSDIEMLHLAMKHGVLDENIMPIK